MSRTDHERDNDDRPGDPPGGVSFLQIVFSTLAAAFGVQSSRNRERDFTHGKALHFIIAGVVFTVLFVAAIVVVVNVVLSGAN